MHSAGTPFSSTWTCQRTGCGTWVPSCACVSRLCVLRVGHPGVTSLTHLYIPASVLDTLHLVTGELHRYDGSLHTCPTRLRSALLEVHSQRHLEAGHALLQDVLLPNRTRSLALLNLRLSVLWAWLGPPCGGWF